MNVDEFKRRMAALIDQFAESAMDAARAQLLAELRPAVIVRSSAIGGKKPRQRREGTKSAKAIELYQAGKTIAEIMEETGLAFGSVGPILSLARREGLVGRRNGRAA